MVREGWDHLAKRRPLAAWGSWQRVLKQVPESTAAAQALATLESAADLPLAARAVYRLRQPASARRRTVWDDHLRALDSRDPDLEAMADVFGRLVALDLADAAAWYNRALCLAWLGANHEAVECLDRVTCLEAEPAFERAVEAWLLAEVLRQGARAGSLADDLRFACTLAWEPGDTPWLLSEFPEIQRVATPCTPGNGHDPDQGVEVFEWLDRSPGGPGLLHRVPRADELPTILASVYLSPHTHTLRLSSPRALTLNRVEELLLPRLEGNSPSIRREASPLGLPFLDADVWTVHIPAGIGSDQSDQLLREWVEHFYENEWIHKSRQGLDGLSPLEASGKVGSGDPVVRAKLTAVVRFREQLGARRTTLRLYQGYPFDRLRCRLGLDLVNPDTVDPDDLACQSPGKLDRLDPAVLDDHRLAEAVDSAAGLRDDARTARLAAELLERHPRETLSTDLALAVAPLLRQATATRDFDAALHWIERARSLCDSRTAVTLDVWRAEILARAGQPELARRAYRGLIGPDAAGAALALDAALTLLDNGHADSARPFLSMACDLARSSGRPWVERRAQALLLKSKMGLAPDHW
jgi:tetratricopeptide (TPR) repeat protein